MQCRLYTRDRAVRELMRHPRLGRRNQRVNQQHRDYRIFPIRYKRRQNMSKSKLTAFSPVPVPPSSRLAPLPRPKRALSFRINQDAMTADLRRNSVEVM